MGHRWQRATFSMAGAGARVGVGRPDRAGRGARHGTAGQAGLGQGRGGAGQVKGARRPNRAGQGRARARQGKR
jgi:hypothetical protein